MTVIYIKNRLPSPKSDTKTSYEIVYKAKPSVKQMRVLGCLAWWTSGDNVPRKAGIVSVGSNSYKEWQNLAYQSIVEEQLSIDLEEEAACVERRAYPYPTKILKRNEKEVEEESPLSDEEST